MAAVYSWGRGEDGQLGLGDTNDQHRPVLVEALKDKNVAQIACGSGHTVVLSTDGEVYTWGRGDDGRLGHGDNGWKYVPRLVASLKGLVIKQVTCGSYHTAAVSENGELYTWGGGMYGKLGHGSENGHSTPCLVHALLQYKVLQVACGSRHTAVLVEGGNVYTWGDRENGVTGHADVDGHQYVPELVAGLQGENISQIAACGFHTAALSGETGELYTWGEGKFGRLGHNTERNQIVPRVVAGFIGQRVTQVACGGFHSAAITEDGRLYTWGGGEHGQLGLGDKVNKTVPCLVEKLNGLVIQQVTCGWSHTVALTSTGAVYTWGNGDHGKLGHNDTTKVTTPKRVEALQNLRVASVASYNEHTAALTEPIENRMNSVSSTFLEDMHSLVDNADFSDVVFVVEHQRVHAHRAILAMRCEHFRAMFGSGMRESSELEITIPNMRHSVFLAILEYLYTDTVDIDVENAVEIYVAADLYTIDRLKGLCETAVEENISIQNAANLLQLADEYHATRIRDLCLLYIVRNFDAVDIRGESFKQLNKDLLLDLLERKQAGRRDDRLLTTTLSASAADRQGGDSK